MVVQAGNGNESGVAVDANRLSFLEGADEVDGGLTADNVVKGDGLEDFLLFRNRQFNGNRDDASAAAPGRVSVKDVLGAADPVQSDAVTGLQTRLAQDTA